MSYEQDKVAGYGFLPSPDIIRMRVEHQWLLDQSSPRGYETGRGSVKNKERGFPETYAQALPSFAGKTIDEWVQEKIDKMGHVTLVDIGYGCGYYLLDTLAQYGKEQVTLIGYGSDKDIYKPYLNCPPTVGAIRQAGDSIRLIRGNIADIDKHLSGVRPDVVCANHVFEWVRYPHWELVKKIYRTMNEGGVGFINECPLRLVTSGDQTDSTLESAFTTYGYRFEVGVDSHISGGLAFMKTHERITAPLRTCLPGDSEHDGGVQYVHSSTKALRTDFR